MSTLVSPVQSWKAYIPIYVTELPIVTPVSRMQPRKATLPIEVTELPIVTLVSPVQPSKADAPIEITSNCLLLYVTLEGMLTSPAYLLSPATTSQVKSVGEITL